MRVALQTGLIAAVAAAAGLAVGANNEKKPDKSPHADAVELVIRTQADEIRKLENTGRGGGGDSWWHDTMERTWIVKRPFAPGMIDSTCLFEVTYRIDSKDVSTWSVDTRKGTATRADARKTK
jgi:hypothetical protein